MDHVLEIERYLNRESVRYGKAADDIEAVSQSTKGMEYVELTALVDAYRAKRVALSVAAIDIGTKGYF